MKTSAYQKGVVNMQYNSKFAGQIIGKLRTDRELSQEMLSRLAGIARSHLANVLSSAVFSLRAKAKEGNDSEYADEISQIISDILTAEEK